MKKKFFIIISTIILIAICAISFVACDQNNDKDNIIDYGNEPLIGNYVGVKEESSLKYYAAVYYDEQKPKRLQFSLLVATYPRESGVTDNMYFFQEYRPFDLYHNDVQNKWQLDQATFDFRFYGAYSEYDLSDLDDSGFIIMRKDGKEKYTFTRTTLSKETFKEEHKAAYQGNN